MEFALGRFLFRTQSSFVWLLGIPSFLSLGASPLDEMLVRDDLFFHVRGLLLPS